MKRQNSPTMTLLDHRSAARELPVGSELLIALTFGLASWYGIVHLVIWIAAR